MEPGLEMAYRASDESEKTRKVLTEISERLGKLSADQTEELIRKWGEMLRAYREEDLGANGKNYREKVGAEAFEESISAEVMEVENALRAFISNPTIDNMDTITRDWGGHGVSKAQYFKDELDKVIGK